MREIPLFQRGVVVAHAQVDDGDVDWLNRRRWLLNHHGYAIRFDQELRRWFLMHREILGLTHGDGRHTDHANRDRLDNQRQNLRVVTAGENRQNVGSKPGSTSRFRGVYFHKVTGLWQARVQVSGKTHYLGCFADELDAARAASKARSELHPFAREEAVA